MRLIVTKKNQLAILASDLDIKFPESPDYIDDKTEEAIQNSILTNGVVYSTDNVAVNKECYLGKNALTTLLKTDVKGVNKLYNNLPKSDKKTNGKDRQIKLSATQKIVSDRIQEPRSPLVNQHLQYVESCLISFRDCPQLQNDRALSNAQIQEKLPKLKSSLIKERELTECEYTGEPLDNKSAAHHRNRKADHPAQSLDPENIDIINNSPHITVHSEDAETSEEVDALADKMGWNKPRNKS